MIATPPASIVLHERLDPRMFHIDGEFFYEAIVQLAFPQARRFNRSDKRKLNFPLGRHSNLSVLELVDLRYGNIDDVAWTYR